MNYDEEIDIASEVDLVVNAYPVQDDGLDEELLAAGNVSLPFLPLLTQKKTDSIRHHATKAPLTQSMELFKSTIKRPNSFHFGQ